MNVERLIVGDIDTNCYIVNIDGKIYAAGYCQNAVTSVSGYDWCIKQY